MRTGRVMWLSSSWWRRRKRTTKCCDARGPSRPSNATAHVPLQPHPFAVRVPSKMSSGASSRHWPPSCTQRSRPLPPAKRKLRVALRCHQLLHQASTPRPRLAPLTRLAGVASRGPRTLVSMRRVCTTGQAQVPPLPAPVLRACAAGSRRCAGVTYAANSFVLPANSPVLADVASLSHSGRGHRRTSSLMSAGTSRSGADEGEEWAVQYKKACGFERAGVYVGNVGLGFEAGPCLMLSACPSLVRRPLSPGSRRL